MNKIQVLPSKDKPRFLSGINGGVIELFEVFEVVEVLDDVPEDVLELLLEVPLELLEVPDDVPEDVLELLLLEVPLELLEVVDDVLELLLLLLEVLLEVFEPGLPGSSGITGKSGMFTGTKKDYTG